MRTVARRVATELLDSPEGAVTPRELRENLADMARFNRLGLVSALLAEMAPFVAVRDPTRVFRVADLGTGGADIPLAIVRWARRADVPVSVLAIDIRPAVLASAAPAVVSSAEIRRIAADALRPPLREQAVDLAVSSLTLHHLSADEVVSLLRTMATVSRLGFIVSDLRRSGRAYLATWLATRFSRNRLTRHDGPLSVLRAYTEEELARLAAAAGLPGLRWRRARFFRVVGVHSHAG